MIYSLPTVFGSRAKTDRKEDTLNQKRRILLLANKSVTLALKIQSLLLINVLYVLSFSRCRHPKRSERPQWTVN